MFIEKEVWTLFVTQGTHVEQMRTVPTPRVGACLQNVGSFEGSHYTVNKATDTDQGRRDEEHGVQTKPWEVQRHFLSKVLANGVDGLVLEETMYGGPVFL